MKKEQLIALIDVLIDERIHDVSTIQGKRGLRGPKGNPGKDGADGISGESFTWDKFKDQILEEIKSNAITGPKGERGDRGLRGLKGAKGDPGLDGKSFNWDEHKESILALIEKQKFKFDGLTEDQKIELKGDRGPRGQRGKPGDIGPKGDPGKGFVFSEHKPEIESIVKDYTLTFSKLTDEQKDELRGQRGPRGQRGKPGQNGLSAYEIWSKYNDGDAKDFLNSLIGKDGKNGLNGVPGLPGINGKDGIIGKDGQDGKDAAEIVDVRLFTTNDQFYFKFYFSDNTIIESNKIDLPKGKTQVSGSESLSIAKNLLQVLDEGIEVASNAASINFTGNLVEATATDSNVEVNINLDNLPAIEKASSLVVSRTVGNGDGVEIGDVVRADTGGFVFRADPTGNISNASALGVCIEAKNQNEQVDVLILGVLENAIFSAFAVNARLFLDDDGAITDVRPTTGAGYTHITPIGKCLGSNQILVDIGETVAL